MNRRPRLDKPRNSIPALLTEWQTLLLIGTALLIVIATLTPFNFTTEGITLKGALRNFRSNNSNLRDIVGNVLLFMPFGFAIALRLQRQLKDGTVRIALPTKLNPLAIALISSFCLSGSVELFQVFLPSRFSSWTDLCFNSCGGYLGALTFCLGQRFMPSASNTQAIVQPIRRALTIPTLAALLIGWVAVTGGVSLAVQNATTLSNWETEMYLTVGSDRWGKHDWKGNISRLEISDRAVPDFEMNQLFQQNGALSQPIASYTLTDSGNVLDRSGNSPELVDRSTEPRYSNEGVALPPRKWFSTELPAVKLSERLRETSEFTLSTTIATENINQPGFSRIIALSKHHEFDRNFILVQSGDRLLFFLRTPLSGNGGIYSVLFAPEALTDKNPHAIVITYRNHILKMFIDNAQTVYKLDLTPESSLFRVLFPFQGQIFKLREFDLSVQKLLYYITFFVPMGAIVSLIAARLKQTGAMNVALIAGGIVVPAVLLEIGCRGWQIQLGNVLLPIAIALLTFALTKTRLTHWLHISPRVTV